MKKYEWLDSLLFILYPKFYTVKDDDENELVFLDYGQNYTTKLHAIKDKTECEALENHFHLFEKVGINNKTYVINIGTKIAENWLFSLSNTFPNKKFIVYLSFSTSESTIIRFHQIWDGEPLYFDVTQFQEENHQVFEFRNN